LPLLTTPPASTWSALALCAIYLLIARNSLENGENTFVYLERRDDEGDTLLESISEGSRLLAVAIVIAT
jgi:hypothetical protein